MSRRVLQVHPYLEAWRTFLAEYPASADIASRLRFLLKYAVLAPSSLNSQPWAFRIEGDTFELYADWSKARPHTDPEGRELVMSCGAALLNLRLAIRAVGLQYELRLRPDELTPLLLARIRVDGERPAELDEKQLFDAIPKRHTERQPFSAKLISARYIAEWTAAAAEESARFRVIPPAASLSVATLAEEAEAAQLHDPAFREEWASWQRVKEEMPDGQPEYATGISATISQNAAILGKAPFLRRKLATAERSLEGGVSLLALIETSGDTLLDWLHAGQGLQRVLLSATSRSVSASFLNHAVQLPSWRARLRDLAASGHHPQALLRLGYAQRAVPATPRRSADDALVDWEPQNKVE